jgi:CRISPR-associated protein Csb3
MSGEKKSNIQVPVDLTNPGQFFACCGLLELADRLWPGTGGLPSVYAWFEQRRFCMLSEDCSKTLKELLSETRTLRFDIGDDDNSGDATNDDAEDSSSVQAIELRWATDKLAVILDWWSEKAIKPWAGSMNERVILRAMLTAIDPVSTDPFNDLRRVQYQPPTPDKKGKPLKPRKREPFYFDPRRGNRSHPLDCGFSPDIHQMEAECCPALEALCFIGLQRARPASTDVANQSRYTVWSKASDDDPGLPACLVGPAACGMIPWPSLGEMTFDNYFRTDRRRLKTYSQASPIRSADA